MADTAQLPESAPVVYSASSSGLEERMLSRRCHVLLVEDDPEDIYIFNRYLEQAESTLFKKGFSLTSAKDLQDALQCLQQPIDVLFLDLMLPDSSGINTLTHIRQAAPTLPIVVQTALDYETVAAQTLAMGACSYLPKSSMDSWAIVCAIRTAIDYQTQLERLTTMGQPHASSDQASLSSVEKAIKLLPLQERDASLFNQFIHDYSELMDKALHLRTHRGDRWEISRSTQLLAERLGYVRASPRDVMDLHTAVLKAKMAQTAQQQKAGLYVDEGNFLALELIGDLAEYYRKFTLGLAQLGLTPTGENKATC